MKKLILFLALFISLGASAQVLNTLPAGSKPYGNQLYITPDGLIIAGTTTIKYRVVGTKSYIDSLNVVYDNKYLPYTGGTLTGALTIQGNNLTADNLYTTGGFSAGTYGGGTTRFNTPSAFELLLGNDPYTGIRIRNDGQILTRNIDGKSVLFEGDAAPEDGSSNAYIKNNPSLTQNANIFMNGYIRLRDDDDVQKIYIASDGNITATGSIQADQVAANSFKGNLENGPSGATSVSADGNVILDANVNGNYPSGDRAVIVRGGHIRFDNTAITNPSSAYTLLVKGTDSHEIEEISDDAYLKSTGGTLTGDLTVNGQSNLNGKTTVGNDIEVTNLTKGVILKSPDGTRWRITVSDTGVLTTTSL